MQDESLHDRLEFAGNPQRPNFRKRACMSHGPRSPQLQPGSALCIVSGTISVSTSPIYSDYTLCYTRTSHPMNKA